MSTLFLRILNFSLVAGWLILAVLLLRVLLKKAPRWISCLLWALVALRLLLPFSVESVLSLIPSSEVIPADITVQSAPAIDTGISFVNRTINPIINEGFAPRTTAAERPMQSLVSIASVIWIVGVLAMLLYALISFLILKRQVRAAIPAGKDSRTYLCDEIRSPFILGIFRPCVYIPSALDEETKKYVSAHESSHIRRRDHLWKPLGFLLLSVYWFQPLCWIAYILLCRDIEAACDEKVIRDRDADYLAAYSRALLDCALQRRRISVCPLAFGENNVKGRIRGILNYKKPAFWLIMLALCACIVAAVCFLTDPPKKETEQNAEEKVAEAGETDTPEGDTEEFWHDYCADSFGGGSVDEERSADYIPTEAGDWTSLGDLDGNGTEEYVVWREGDESDDYTFYWDLYFNCELIRQEENILPCSFNEAWYLDLDGDGKEEIFIPYYPAVNSMPQMQYLALRKNGSVWEEMENTETDPSSDIYTNAFPVDVYVGAEKTLYEICCASCEPIEYDVTEHYTKIYESEEGTLKQLASEILYGDKYGVPGVRVGGAAAWGIWELMRASYEGRDCIIARHGIQGPGEKFDILGLLDVYFCYDKEGKIQILKTEFTSSEAAEVQQDAAGGEDLLDRLSVGLPEGYSIGEYSDMTGYMGGALILPRSYEAEGSASAPAEWMYSGLISRYPAGSPQVGITFSNGCPGLSGVPMDNHTDREYLLARGTDAFDSSKWPLIMMKESHDLYTASEIEEMRQAGVDTSKIGLSSEYWCFWFVKEDADSCYILTLSAKEFTEEQAKEIAFEVRIMG